MNTRNRFIRKNKADFGYGLSKHEFNFSRQRRTTTPSPSIVSLFVRVVEFLLGFRFIFEAFGVSSSNGLTHIIYLLSDPFIQPFHSFFSVANFAYAFIDWSILIAMIAYLFIGSGLNKMLRTVNGLETSDLDQRAFTQ